MTTRFFKDSVKHRLLHAANYRRVHIVGCARSGTTMLYFLMMAFQNMILINREISVWNWPTLRESFKLALKNVLNGKRHFLVTKRNATWYEPEKLNRLIQYAKSFHIGIIHLVRDPRDVLTSEHKGQPGTYYVNFTKWRDSIEAGETLQDQLRDFPGLLTLRYEDIVTDPDQTGELLMQTYGFQLKPGISSLKHMEEYVDPGLQHSKMVTYMHQLREIGTSSFRKWEKDPKRYQYLKSLWDDPEKRTLLERFLKKYNYPITPFETEEPYNNA